ncbi:MAG: DNA repair protein RecN [Calditrichaeota bacterium]|nr:MAG: DNA repair protein RecN [Calditrichota bacterium]
MLKNVLIKNFAIVDEISINFKTGLNVFTGETGAGKSIIIGAISALLGEKIAATAIRDGADKAIIEGEFDISKLSHINRILKNSDMPVEDGSLILRREINKSGRSRAFVNDSPVKLDDLAELSEQLLDLHGQHEHQSLLHVSSHLDFLDSFGNTVDLRDEVVDLYKNAETLRKEIEALREQQAEFHSKQDFLQFQLDEINAVSPLSGEEEQLLKEEKKLASAHEILDKINTVSDTLYDDEKSAVSSISKSISALQVLSEIDSKLAEHLKEAESVVIVLEEITRSLRSYAAKIDTDPKQLEDIRTRLGEFSFLKKKFGPTIDNVLARREEIAAALRNIESLDSDIAAKENQWNDAINIYKNKAVSLSEARAVSAKKLEKLIPGILVTLGMPHTEFFVSLSKKEVPTSWFEFETHFIKPSAHGIDLIEFFIKTNPGQVQRPLVQIASGGEVSRIMLALKSVIAHAVKIPVLLFDEIDTGVSGRIAHAVGLKMKALAKSHQIICITHLPQIASAGDFHFLVEKSSDNSKTSTQVRLLNDVDREQAIAQLLAGKEITETHLATARELLK